MKAVHLLRPQDSNAVSNTLAQQSSRQFALAAAKQRIEMREREESKNTRLQLMQIRQQENAVARLPHHIDRTTAEMARMNQKINDLNDTVKVLAIIVVLLIVLAGTQWMG